MIPPRPRRLPGDGKRDDAARHFGRQFHEAAARVVRAGVVDQQANLEVVGHRAHAVQRIGGHQIHTGDAHLPAACAQFFRQRFQRTGLARHQHHAEALAHQLAGESRPHPFRSANDQRPGAVFGQVHVHSFTTGNHTALACAPP